MRPASKLLSILSLALVFGTGCGVNSTQQASPTPGSRSLEGSAHGGRQPIAGAHIYLFAANTSAYGAPSVPLLNPTYPGVATDFIGPYTTTASDGSFSLTNAYTCSPGQQVYAFLTGGNPGLPPGSVNSSLGLLAVLGHCPDTGTLARPVPFISINEVSTIATAYALAGFMTDPIHVSSGPSAASLRGLTNAFGVVNNLINIDTGTARNQNLAGNGVVPQAEINTLADTATAAIKLARNPALNVDTLFGLVPSAAPFQPTLANKPNDWTIGITYFAQNMVGPYFPAFDFQGNLWVPSYTTNTLVEFDPLGTPLSGNSGFGGGGLNQPYAVAVNSVDNVWAVNFEPIGGSGVSRFRNDGTPITSSAYSCSSACFFPAFDTTGNLWISGATQTTVLASDGTRIASFGMNAYNSGIVIDSSGSAWTLGHGCAIYRLTRPSSSATFTQTVTVGSGNELTPMAVDSSDDIWFVSNRNNAIGKLSSVGTPLSPSGGYTGGGLKGPAGIAVDGDGNVWVANRDGNSVSAFTNDGTAITPSTGYTAQNLSGPRGLAIDLSGNIWIANFTSNSVTEFVGLAAPVSTPIMPSTQGRRP